MKQPGAVWEQRLEFQSVWGVRIGVWGKFAALASAILMACCGALWRCVA